MTIDLICPDDGQSITFSLRSASDSFWQEHPCGTKFADAPLALVGFTSWLNTLAIARMAHPSGCRLCFPDGLRVLEIGCGWELTVRNSLKLVQTTLESIYRRRHRIRAPRFELFDLSGTFQTGDAENSTSPMRLSNARLFAWRAASHPDIQSAVRETTECCAQAASQVMLYHRNSYNYRVISRCCVAQEFICCGGMPV